MSSLFGKKILKNIEYPEKYSVKSEKNTPRKKIWNPEIYSKYGKILEKYGKILGKSGKIPARPKKGSSLNFG